MEVIKFDPAIADLQAIIAETAKITADDLSDTKQLELVRKTRIKLKNARVTIEKQGKAMREDALKYQKDVIAREKELVAIIEPEEERLKAIEAEAERIKERAARMSSLPMRREQLAAIGDGIEVSDDALLDMDTEQFVAYMNGRKVAQFEKLEAKRRELEADQEWHHNMIFGGRQVQAKFAILPILKRIHEKANNRTNKQYFDWIMLNRATLDELRRYSKTINYVKRRDWLNKRFKRAWTLGRISILPRME